MKQDCTLEKHFQFVRSIIKRYNWEPKTKEELDSELHSLQKRFDDQCVNIAVVGEFSSGKSSVINAMLGIDLLVMDDMTDTTLVPSVIAYSAEPTLEVLYNNGQRCHIKVTSIKDIGDTIAEYSFRDAMVNQEENAEAQFEEMQRLRADIIKKALAIKCFHIGIPSSFLRQGFRIIDTPGLNSLNENCTKITGEVLAEADSAIIVGKATSGLTENFREKIVKALGCRINQSCVVFTHFDKTTPMRRDKTLVYLQAVTASYFNANPKTFLVVPMVPPTVLCSIKGERFGEEHDEMLRLTVQSLHKVIDFSIKQRENTIVQNLQIILVRTLSNLELLMQKLQRNYEQRLRELEMSKMMPIETFVDKQLKASLVVIQQNSIICRANIENELDKIINDTKRQLEKQILRQADLTKLNDFMQKKLPEILQKTSEEMKKQDFEGRQYMIDVLATQLSVFEQSLKKEFSRLHIVQIVNFSPDDILKKIRFIDVVPINPMQRSIEFTNSEMNRGDRATGLAVIGGLLGFIFLSPFGACVGGLLGALLGGGTRSYSVKDVFNRIKPKYESELNEILSLERSNVLAAYDNSQRENINVFRQQLYSYQRHYKSEVDSLIAEEKEHKIEICFMIERIKRDLNEIVLHQKEINRIWKIN